MLTNHVNRLNNIKLVILDVDGTLTDGKIHYGQTEELFKSFNVRDGFAIVKSLKYLKYAIITGRKSEIVTNRAEELGIEIVYQGIKNKKEILFKIMKEYGYEKNEIAYIGDDLNDLILFNEVIFFGCPKNSIKEVLEKAHFISNYDGGDGAAREFIEYILKAKNVWCEITKEYIFGE